MIDPREQTSPGGAVIGGFPRIHLGQMSSSRYNIISFCMQRLRFVPTWLTHSQADRHVQGRGQCRSQTPSDSLNTIIGGDPREVAHPDTDSA